MLYSEIKDSLDERLNLNSKSITNNNNFTYFVRDIVENEHLGDIFIDEKFTKYIFS